ncbi:unnamed protein product [Effrenium voratum]|nr:unnamed protein product [Effrenium voratum]
MREDLEWPPYFLSSEGHLRSGGVLGVGDFPRTFDGTRGASLGRVPAPPRVLAADSFGGGGGDRGAHELAKQRAAEFQRCWAELIAPDGRAYWYDYVSNAWMWERPKELLRRRGQLHSARQPSAPSAPSHSLGVPMDQLLTRLAQVQHAPSPKRDQQTYQAVPQRSHSEVFAEFPPGFRRNAKEDVVQEGTCFINKWTQQRYHNKEEAIQDSEVFYQDLWYLKAHNNPAHQAYWVRGRTINDSISAWTLPVLYQTYQQDRGKR